MPTIQRLSFHVRGQFSSKLDTVLYIALIILMLTSFNLVGDRDLTPLAKLGVLFLNSSLTVRAHKANSHSKKGWEQLTTAALRAVAHREDMHVVFLAWGAPAQAMCKAVGIDEVRSSCSQTEKFPRLIRRTLQTRHLVLK